MSITLKIVSYQRHTPEQHDSYSSDKTRISIGRNADNDFPLPDPQRFMSGLHCWIENRNDGWELQDVSTNGVFINGSKERIPKDESVSLNEGDLIKLGDYELEFSTKAVREAEPEEAEETDFFAAPKDPEARAATSRGQKDVNTPLSQMDEGMLADQISIDEIHGLNPPEEDPDPPSLQGKESRGSALRQHFRAPEVTADPPQEPEAPSDANDDLMAKYRLDPDELPHPEWDEATGTWKSVAKPDTPAQAISDETGKTDQGSDAPGTTPVEAEAPEQEQVTPESLTPKADSPKPRTPGPRIKADSALAAFMEGAGLDPSKFRPEDEAAFFFDLGMIIQNMTEGLMHTLASRRHVKREFRVDETQVGIRDNNPLKWAVSADEALTRLMTNTDSAYLSGPEAVSQALDDLNAHQLAALAGTEAALRNILKRFKPENVESRLDSGSVFGKLIPGFKKARHWDLYRALYNEVSEAADDDFQHLFGSQFRKAYEEQLNRIASSRKESSQ
ncbi:MAG TPA: type VI secretion system-associated FHA domain protein TagH [Xanthomonadales bacterium]|nr:type VI secretion system-associated FHA domain protein TagH [Xanthomonadales bacterium]